MIHSLPFVEGYVQNRSDIGCDVILLGIRPKRRTDFGFTYHRGSLSAPSLLHSHFHFRFRFHFHFRFHFRFSLWWSADHFNVQKKEEDQSNLGSLLVFVPGSTS